MSQQRVPFFERTLLNQARTSGGTLLNWPLSRASTGVISANTTTAASEIRQRINIFRTYVEEMGLLVIPISTPQKIRWGLLVASAILADRSPPCGASDREFTPEPTPNQSSEASAPPAQAARNGAKTSLPNRSNAKAYSCLCPYPVARQGHELQQGQRTRRSRSDSGFPHLLCRLGRLTLAPRGRSRLPFRRFPSKFCAALVCMPRELAHGRK